MNLLFDTSPQGDPPKKKARKATAMTPPPEEVYVAPQRPVIKPKTLGRVDEGVACLDQNCRAECHDITDEDRGWWRLECCFCGTGQWIPAEKRPAAAVEPASDGVFRFPEDTRYPGLTPAEAAARCPRHKEWFAYAAKNHPDEAVKKACEAYLASSGSVG
jgi:hypothetical protein